MLVTQPAFGGSGTLGDVDDRDGFAVDRRCVNLQRIDSPELLLSLRGSETFNGSSITKSMHPIASC